MGGDDTALETEASLIFFSSASNNTSRFVEKLGIQQVGYAPRFLHIDGEWRDHRQFAITAEECRGGLVRRVDPPES